MSCGTETKFLGKYRATVVANLDPLQIGRIQVIVPDVSNLIPTSWAMPCVPIAGKQMGTFVLPQVGDGVWVEFEQGDPDYPIWVGGFWGSAAEVPAAVSAFPPALPPIVLQSQAQNRLVISSVPGQGLRLDTAAGQGGPSIEITSVGITLTDGQGASIVLTGGTVTVNNGALVVLK